MTVSAEKFTVADHLPMSSMSIHFRAKAAQHDAGKVCMVDKIEVFISYAQEDEGLRKELETQLGTLERRELIKIWHNRKVSAGADLKQEVARHLNTAQIILLLIGPAFMASDDPYGTEMKRAMERCNAGEVRVIPILLRPVHYKGAPFDHLKILPSNRKPITSSSWHNRDEAFFDVVEGIQEVVEELMTKTPVCYYAGGSKDVPGEASAPTSASTAAPTGLTAGKRARLVQELKGYQGERVLLAELVGRIRRELIIETSVVRKFQLEQQLQENEASLTRLDGKIEQIEQTLTQLEPKEGHSAVLEYPQTSIQPETTSSKSTTQAEHFDVFLSYSSRDAEWVEHLARRLEDEQGLHVWLDKWVLVAGQPWQQAMARGIDQAGCCAVCIGEYTPIGWFKREIERALDRQTKVPSFRVIPVLLPNAKRVNVDDFLELNTRVDFRGSDQDYAFHVLVCGVKGIPPGRWPPK